MPITSALCQSCGFCCDGTLHKTLAIEATEKSQFQLEFIRMPCSYFQNDQCSIYSQRPKGCCAYKCAVYKKLESGDIEMGECKKLINEVKALKQAVIKSIGPMPAAATIWEHIESFGRAADMNDNRHSEFYLAVGKLHLLLQRFNKE